MLNPWVLLGLVVAWCASVGGAFFYGQGIGRDGEIAGQAKIKQAIEDTREQAQQGAAQAIARIEVKNVTINRKLETVVRENPVFRDCRSGADSMRLFNSGIPGYTEPAGGGIVPAKDATAR